MSLNIYNITINSATLEISNMRYWEKGYDYFEITGDISKTWSGGGQNYYTSTNLTGLNSGQTYHIYVWGFYDGGQEYFGDITFTTKASNPRPSNWSWTTTERNALENKGKVSNITWDRWNLFVDKIIAFRNYKNLSTYVNIGGTSYAITNAKVSSNNKTLTALRFNIANQAITEMNSTSIEKRSTGDEVHGLMFLIFENKLNGIP